MEKEVLIATEIKCPKPDCDCGMPVINAELAAACDADGHTNEIVVTFRSAKFIGPKDIGIAMCDFGARLVNSEKAQTEKTTPPSAGLH